MILELKNTVEHPLCGIQWVAQPIFPIATMNPTTPRSKSDGLPWTAHKSPVPRIAPMTNHARIAENNFIGGY